MTVTLNLSPEQEQRLRAGTAVETLPSLPSRKISASKLSALLDEIASMFQDAPVLPDEALTREGIYGDHP